MDVAIVGGTGTVGAEAARSGVPWTIVRATQFHTLVARTFAASPKLGVLPSARVPLQPVDPREERRALAHTAEAEPPGAWRGTVTLDARPGS